MLHFYCFAAWTKEEKRVVEAGFKNASSKLSMKARCEEIAKKIGRTWQQVKGVAIRGGYNTKD